MKRAISFAIRYIPRKYLQLFSHWVAKVLSLFYLGNKVECNVCNHKYRKFLPYGRKARSNALCPNCLSLERHRMMWWYLKGESNFLQPGNKILHIAPELCFIKRFESIHGDNYITADIESPLAKVKLDVHDIPFDEGEFDIIFCNHVMEHVDNDLKAMSEIHRVMKPGGWGILQIPLFHPIPNETFEDFSITDPVEREKVFGQRDHVRLYGKDYIDRLRSAGFDAMGVDPKEKLSMEILKKHSLPLDEPIFLVRK
ncbi:MAG: class I SAM-dependent methyltransferase [Desulfobulbia bacterium]